MNILFMNSIAADAWGGGEKWMLTAGKGLRTRGHTISYCGRRRSLFLERCAAAGFPAHGLDIGSDFGPLNIVRLARMFRSTGSQIAIVNFNKDAHLAGTAARLVGGVRVVARNGLPILPNRLRFRLTYRWFVDGIITNTETIRSRYLRYGWMAPDFIRTIHNGIDSAQPVAFESQTVRDRFRLPPGAPIAGIFGRLVSQKGHEGFLCVAREIKNEFTEALFLIVGDGPLRAQLEKRAAQMGIAENVCFLGFQGESEVVELLSICDLVLLTSNKEGLPNAVLEAMLCGRAVAAYDVGGVRELIPEESGAGVVVPAGDAHALAVKSLALLRSPETRQAIGERARCLVLERFSVDRMCDELETYLLRVWRSRQN